MESDPPSFPNRLEPTNDLVIMLKTAEHQIRNGFRRRPAVTCCCCVWRLTFDNFGGSRITKANICTEVLVGILHLSIFGGDPVLVE
eukprot:gene18446-21548_t